tara:strand:- start:329 stop:499 length:171 start_codon:yes stop_codon:yes gene_type:complete
VEARLGIKMTKKKKQEDRLPRNPLVPQLNKHKNQLFKDKKKEKSKNICRERVKDST